MKRNCIIVMITVFLLFCSSGIQAQTTKQVKQMAYADSLRLVEIFKDIHQNPELGFMEVRTSGNVAKELKSLGYEVITGIGKTGLVGILKMEKDRSLCTVPIWIVFLLKKLRDFLMQAIKP